MASVARSVARPGRVPLPETQPNALLAASRPRACVQVLDKNFEYIKVIADYQKRGMLKDALQYQQLLKNNLTLLASQAERTPPSDISQVLCQHYGGGGSEFPLGLVPELPCTVHVE
jgi:hypothetical protein